MNLDEIKFRSKSFSFGNFPLWEVDKEMKWAADTILELCDEIERLDKAIISMSDIIGVNVSEVKKLAAKDAELEQLKNQLQEKDRKITLICSMLDEERLNKTNAWMEIESLKSELNKQQNDKLEKENDFLKNNLKAVLSIVKEAYYDAHTAGNIPGSGYNNKAQHAASLMFGWRDSTKFKEWLNSVNEVVG